MRVALLQRHLTLILGQVKNKDSSSLALSIRVSNELSFQDKTLKSLHNDLQDKVDF